MFDLDINFAIILVHWAMKTLMWSAKATEN